MHDFYKSLNAKGHFFKNIDISSSYLLVNVFYSCYYFFPSSIIFSFYIFFLWYFLSSFFSINFCLSSLSPFFLSSSLSLSLSLESILTRYETRRFRFPFLFHREIHRYRLYLIDRAESEFHDVLRRRRRLRVGGSHKYNLDSSDHMPLESRPFFFPARRFMAGFPYCSVSKYQGEKCLDVYIEKWKKCWSLKISWRGLFR